MGSARTVLRSLSDDSAPPHAGMLCRTKQGTALSQNIARIKRINLPYLEEYGDFDQVGVSWGVLRVVYGSEQLHPSESKSKVTPEFTTFERHRQHHSSKLTMNLIVTAARWVVVSHPLPTHDLPPRLHDHPTLICTPVAVRPRVSKHRSRVAAAVFAPWVDSPVYAAIVRYINTITFQVVYPGEERSMNRALGRVTFTRACTLDWLSHISLISYKRRTDLISSLDTHVRSKTNSQPACTYLIVRGKHIRPIVP